MKQILLIAGLFFTITAQAQVNKDVAAGVAYVNITHTVLPAFLRYTTGVDSATRLYVELSRDDLYGEAQFYYYVKGPQTDDTTKYRIITQGTFRMSGADYSGWDANHNDVPFSFIAERLMLELE